MNGSKIPKRIILLGLAVIILVLIIAIQCRGLLISKDNHVNDLYNKASMMMGIHYGSMDDINSLANEIIKQGDVNPRSVIILMREIAVAELAYSDAMVVLDNSTINEVRYLLLEYSDAIGSYLFHNLLSDEDIDSNDYDIFVLAVTELEAFSKWVLNNYAVEHPRIIYTEKDLKESDIYIELTIGQGY